MLDIDQQNCSNMQIVLFSGNFLCRCSKMNAHLALGEFFFILRRCLCFFLLFFFVHFHRMYLLFLSAFVESALAAIFTLLASKPQGT